MEGVDSEHDVKYDLTADLTGTRDKSEYKKYVKHSFYIVCYVDTDK